MLQQADILDGRIDVERVTRVEERIGQVERDFERAARADAGAGDAVDLRGVATHGTMPVAQVLVVL